MADLTDAEIAEIQEMARKVPDPRQAPGEWYAARYAFIVRLCSRFGVPATYYANTGAAGDLTAEEIARLRDPASYDSLQAYNTACRLALQRLLDEVERRRREMKSMIPVPSYRCERCGEMVPDNVPMVKEHLRSERHLAATGRK